jgi:hypothetical protein
LAPPRKAAVRFDGDFLQRPAAEATWVTTSAHQVSFSIIFCKPRNRHYQARFRSLASN